MADFWGSSGFGGDGTMNAATQLSGMEGLGPGSGGGGGFGQGFNLKKVLQGLKDLQGGGGWEQSALRGPAPQAPAAPRPAPIMYDEGMTPHGLRYRVAKSGPNAGVVEWTGGGLESYGRFKGLDPKARG